ncbi:MAG: hypothetical protein GTO53_09475 [Planctomycetales bacterium]|nr:hypothetical protein [Planctomycetales bacterium]NIM09356.1 hypothetical protein [Planctomycetales bacterium]NIN08823.1 hypothetical protein [Planctomycetales bacterium]NIN77940.1 hypothetical protein [Planctomycetales bacterium]NIO35123.1 hypothetical protein [Planctomycetales bacterium]
MSHLVSVTLDSYQWTGGQSPIDCHICNAANTADADLCQKCFAPLALTRQAQEQKTAPVTLAVLGAAGAGKTVYLGMLMDMLSRRKTGLQLVARGAFSINMQQTTARALARSQFPEKTPNEPDRWNWVHCQLRRPKVRKPQDVIIPDPAGESILEELDHPGSYPGVQAVLQRCRGVLLLVDTVAIEEGSPDQEYFAMKVLGYLAELRDGAKKGWTQRPVGILFTKADQCETCFENPQRYAQRRASALWRQCEELFPRHAFFACSVAGGSGYRVLPDHELPVLVPLRVEPRGIVEPFQWLIQHVRK